MRYRSKTQRLVLISLIAAAAIVLSYFERFIPLPVNLPGMKLGLANIMTVSALFYFNKKEVLMMVIIRVFVTSLIIGSVMSFAYSLAGGILSFLGMAFLYKYFLKWLSTIGISVMGAFLHNVAQLAVLAVVAKSLSVSLSYGPIIIFTSLATGVFVGIASFFFIEKIMKLHI